MAEKGQNESIIHKLVVRYLSWLKLLYNHSPNEGKRSPQQASYLKSLGMQAGFPDLFIYEPTTQYHGLAIELKRERGGRVSEAQKHWIDELNKRGYLAVVCKGYDEAQRVIDDYRKDITHGRKKDDVKADN